MKMLSVKAIIASLSIFVVVLGVSARTEEERLKEYHARGYEWPLKKLNPDTPGWRSIFYKRFEQIEETIVNEDERYEAWVQVMSSALVQPNFTENG